MSENMCKEHNEPILPDEDGNCSLCGCALDMFGQELPDEIQLSWHIDDVKCADEDREDDSTTPLTDNQCRRVLQALKLKHDASVGVNWDVINYWIDEIREQDKL